MKTYKMNKVKKQRLLACILGALTLGTGLAEAANTSTIEQDGETYTVYELTDEDKEAFEPTGYVNNIVKVGEGIKYDNIWDIYGGKNGQGIGDVKNNTVSIDLKSSPAKYYKHTIYGGYIQGKEKENIVDKLNKPYYANTNGNVNNNKVLINAADSVLGEDIFGGYHCGTGTGAVIGNEVEINADDNSTIKGDVCGGYGTNTVYGKLYAAPGDVININVKDNKVTINGGIIDLDATGGTYLGKSESASGYAKGLIGGTLIRADGTVEGNSLTIDGSKLHRTVNATADFGKLKGDSTVTFDTVIAGGYIAANGSGSALGNTLTIKDSAIYYNIKGIESEDDRKIELLPKLYRIMLAGGYASNGAASGNTATLALSATQKDDFNAETTASTYNFYEGIYGGYAGAGDADHNALTIESGEFCGGITEGSGIFGGYTNSGEAHHNLLTISGGNVHVGNADRSYQNGYAQYYLKDEGGLFGGFSKLGDASDNTLYIDGGEVGVCGRVLGGGRTMAGNAARNTLTINGESAYLCSFTFDTYSDIYGKDGVSGSIFGGYTADGVVNDNKVNISSGKLVTTFGAHDEEVFGTHDTKINIYGGRTDVGNAANNEVNIDGGSISGYHVYGGSTASGSAIGNKVTISKEAVFSTEGKGHTIHVATYEVSNSIYGGYSPDGEVKDNTVTISGGTFDGGQADDSGIYGGGSQNGKVSGNKVYISGGTIKAGTGSRGNIYGGILINPTESSASATGNLVDVSGGEFDSDLYGGYVYMEDGSTPTQDCITDNTLRLSNDYTLSNDLFNFDYAYLDGASLSGNELSNVNHITARQGNNSVSGLKSKTGKIESLNVDTGAVLNVSDCAELPMKKLYLKEGGTLVLSGQLFSDDFTAKADSVLVLDGAEVSSETAHAINDVATSSIDQTAKLYVNNVKKGEVYHILAPASQGTTLAEYQDAMLISSDRHFKLVNLKGEADGSVDIQAVRLPAKEIYGDDVIIPDAVDEAEKEENKDTPAQEFFDKVPYANPSYKDEVKAINSVAEMGALGGLTHGTYRAAGLFTDAFTDHLSRDIHPERHRDLWAVYTHSKETVGGMGLAGGLEADYDLQINGVVVGSDLYQKGTATAGIAISYADGSASGWNGVARTKNEADYYGIALYGRKDCGKMSYLGDITYLHGNNDLTQQNSGQRLSADADTDALTLGLTAQREYKTSHGCLIPYAGLRYMMLGTGDYTDSLGLKHDADDQNLLTIPVGIKYAADIEDPCGWTWRPRVEAGYVWNVGDRDTSERVTYHGVGNSFGYDTLDAGSLVLKLGIQAEKGDQTYGLTYEHHNGSTTEANIFRADVKIRF